MIKAVITKNGNDYVSFKCSGHAGFAKRGKDIVCASVSVLTINTLNSIEALTECPFKGSENDGALEWEFTEGCTDDARLLMDSLVMGLDQISKEYKNLLKIEMKEV